ncbi:LEAF RUST 10 DISEASE-RESISTANCE LOCUS RECEPTOR-LIKE PROTEIN KINASE-like 2.5 isoform X2 [Benincasa hispida]|uniref:LEAF RUST 10 DISEASE-RESISTANCE LOCUS RECEPTOR-LIKE PROTEIN KINASE-like 2.5 isoform X2 n=1 Tax=Benincasa hispida TaxID=102211 RepID=UPI001900CFB0|nr:LEAF RUST 10 DISEASE-RESISTANCE LOCUS RECEPTOR-LIKE PROTEIN KINASE-like 2.5 isoform X2 [Benincasa hispida]
MNTEFHMGLFCFLLSFVLTQLVALPLARRDSSYVRPFCPLFECGNLGLIGFPFNNVSLTDCGLYTVKNCSGQPKIQLKREEEIWFDVVAISQSNVIHIDDPELQKRINTRSCSILDDLALPTSPSSSLSADYTLTLYNCTHKPIDGLPLFDSSFSCPGYYSYVNTSASPNCPTSKSEFFIPIRPIDANNSAVEFTSNFQLQVTISTPCTQCFRSGGQCSNTRGQFVCKGGNTKIGQSNLQKKIFITGSIIVVISTVIFIYKKRKGMSNKNKIDEIIRRCSTHTPKQYSYSKLKKITDSFKNKLGQGGFSSIYKGKLPDGREVAVKLLNESNDNGEDFMNEVVSITRTSHLNIVTLLGFCYEQGKRALVYEYMPKGSLDKYIFHRGQQRENETVMDWNMLYSIVTGVARGLEYLHQGCNTRILHFDIKPHNILLDNEFCPKISDFGLAKQCKARESHMSMTGVKGTAGFMAPEVIFRNFGKVSHKSDVYSFGMLVLEMVGERKRPGELGVGENKEEYFPDWIYEDLGRSDVDGGLWWGSTEEEEERARKMIIVGLWCIQTLPEERPSMSVVVAMLEGSVDGLQIPPKPTLFQPPTAFPHRSSSSSSYCITTLEDIFRFSTT